MTIHILVVDDEPDLELLVRQKFRRRIREHDYDISFARDGEEALEMVRNDPSLDIVLTDINMPRMDGLTLLKHLSEFGRLMRVVMVSAYGDMKNIRTAMNNGAFDFVMKPIDFADLERTIDKTIADLSIVREAREQLEQTEAARANLASHFSPSLADYLAEHPERMEPGGARHELSFLFTDIAEFTPLVEKCEPAETVSLLNEYINSVAKIVFEHGGTLNTVIGDAVSAIFGAPIEQNNHAARAVACALDIDAFTRAFSAEKRHAGIPLGTTRIGVHTGPAVVGNFGGETFSQYTAHGDAVNTAARLEAANKTLGTRICVSAETVAQIPGFIGRPAGSLTLKGKKQTIEVFEPIPEEDLDATVLASYQKAFSLIKACDQAAMPLLAAYVGKNPNDPLATFHLERLLSGKRGADVDVN